MININTVAVKLVKEGTSVIEIDHVTGLEEESYCIGESNVVGVTIHASSVVEVTYKDGSSTFLVNIPCRVI